MNAALIPLAAYSTDPAPKVSPRYHMAPTLDTLKPMFDAGWTIQRSMQARTRKPGNERYARHTLYLRHPDMTFPGEAGRDLFPEVAFTNAHSGRNSAVLHAGIFRLVCKNGLTAPFADITHLHLRHSRKDIIPRLLEGLDIIRNNMPAIYGQVEKMLNRILSRDEQLTIATRALKARYGDNWPVLPSRLLEARRTEDVANDAWTVLNRIQENIIRGGFTGTTSDGRQVRVRAINHPLEMARINMDLWMTARNYVS